ncbi:regulatory protein, Fis family [Vibrio xiamenensis]|uniref:Regulatory protein, Fis family n=1 Tax=Vibrio xiamenensis TaxID=861298 RepID=A0A1G8GGA3_9VIBR|nr:sigma-54 dependent transcriptional regulator [Vibrio xiamenensis]SDH93408.1 regulatory protein, Fis family [Vibrio xiamenensis]
MVTLLSWLGRTDLDRAKDDGPASIATIALKGPLLDEVIILASTWDDEWHDYKEWLKKKLTLAGRSKTSVVIQRVRLLSPIDYSSITKVMHKQLGTVCSNSDKVYLNLTSGTPAMAAVSVLLGKGTAKCQLVQTSPQGEIIEVDIPIDFAAEYKKSSSSAISQLVSQNPALNRAFDTITAKSELMHRVIRKAQKLAYSDLPALILGESGVGKEVMATAIHNASQRANKSFKAVNCGALPENLVDSILFGHVKGAFTGADKNHAGLFEQADGGTLFLDEVGELPFNVQVKLLRALQQKEITRVGDTVSKSIDVRIIAATHQDLFSMISDGSFREDLFYRLAVGVIEVPALRKRPEDIPDLISTLMLEINRQAHTHPLFESKKISKDAINFAISYSWPGNIRELWNTLNRAVLWSEGEMISMEDLKSSVLSAGKDAVKETGFTMPGDLQQYIDSIKKDAVIEALESCSGNKSKAAKMLGLNNHQTLNNWMKNLGLED